MVNVNDLNDVFVFWGMFYNIFVCENFLDSISVF